MTTARSAGILLHPTSLPGPGGIGDLGPGAHRWVRWLAEAGMRLWQLLPVGPPGFGNSPYQCFSAFAGNPLLLHVPGWSAAGPTDRVAFDSVGPAKQVALQQWLDALPMNREIEAYAGEQAHWLPDYALFMALKQAHHGRPWTAWEPGAALRDPAALESWRDRLRPEIDRCYKEQYLFAQQMGALRDACHEQGITLIGDMPIYVAHDSADVWAHRQLFALDSTGGLQTQAGVPPDYFSPTGQLWGNPLYAWDRMRADDFAWWTARVRHALTQFDRLRLDHFRGFAAFWEIPGDASTAEHGLWQPGPGQALFEAMTSALGPLPIVAEDLGLITPDVHALRRACDFPGMAVLQFAFDSADSSFLPHNHTRHLVVYTGTHDNDTTCGWWAAGADALRAQVPSATAVAHAFARAYLDTDGTDMPWPVIRAAFASVADTALVPIQDLLAEGSEARMNRPGVATDNWGYRFQWDQLTPARTARLRSLATLYGRTPSP